MCIQKEHLVAMWKVWKVSGRPGGVLRCSWTKPVPDSSLDREFKEVDSTGLDHSEQHFFVVSWPSSTHILYFRSPGDTPLTYSQLIWFSGAPPWPRPQPAIESHLPGLQWLVSQSRPRKWHWIFWARDLFFLAGLEYVGSEVYSCCYSHLGAKDWSCWRKELTCRSLEKRSDNKEGNLGLGMSSEPQIKLA